MSRHRTYPDLEVASRPDWRKLSSAKRKAVYRDAAVQRARNRKLRQQVRDLGPAIRENLSQMPPEDIVYDDY